MENFYANQCALTSHLNVVQCATCYHIPRSKTKMEWEKANECELVCVCVWKNAKKNAKKGELHTFVCMKSESTFNFR